MYWFIIVPNHYFCDRINEHIVKLNIFYVVLKTITIYMHQQFSNLQSNEQSGKSDILKSLAVYVIVVYILNVQGKGSSPSVQHTLQFHSQVICHTYTISTPWGAYSMALSIGAQNRSINSAITALTGIIVYFFDMCWTFQTSPLLQA